MPFNILNSVAKLPKNFVGVQNLWVAVGDITSTSIKPFYSSLNGKDTWTQGTSTNFFQRLEWQSVAYGKGTWVAVASDGNDIAYSNDGKIWSKTNGNYDRGRRVAYGKDNTGADIWVIIGYGSSSVLLSWSSDGLNWNSSGSIGGGNPMAVAYGKDASGAGLWVASSDTSIVYSSTGKGNWNIATYISSVSRIAYGKDASGAGLWIATTPTNGYSSTNGSIWSIVSGMGGHSNVAYGKDASGAGVWVAGSSSLPYIKYSSNGTNWTATTSIERNGCVDVYAIAYGKDGSGNGLWLISGSSSGNTLFHSANGKNWTKFISTNNPTNLQRVQSMAFNNVDL
jgi:hypothetical protein